MCFGALPARSDGIVDTSNTLRRGRTRLPAGCGPIGRTLPGRMAGVENPRSVSYGFAACLQPLSASHLAANGQVLAKRLGLAGHSHEETLVSTSLGSGLLGYSEPP